MVEPQIVVLVVAGSSPVGHPDFRSPSLKILSPNAVGGIGKYSKGFRNHYEIVIFFIGSPAIPKAHIPPYSVFNLSEEFYLNKYVRLIGGISNLTGREIL